MLQRAQPGQDILLVELGLVVPCPSTIAVGQRDKRGFAPLDPLDFLEKNLGQAVPKSPRFLPSSGTETWIFSKSWDKALGLCPNGGNLRFLRFRGIFRLDLLLDPVDLRLGQAGFVGNVPNGELVIEKGTNAG